MKIEIQKHLIELAYSKGIYIDFNDTIDDVIGRILIIFLSKI